MVYLTTLTTTKTMTMTTTWETMAEIAL